MDSNFIFRFQYKKEFFMIKFLINLDAIFLLNLLVVIIKSKQLIIISTIS